MRNFDRFCYFIIAPLLIFVSLLVSILFRIGFFYDLFLVLFFYILSVYPALILIDRFLKIKTAFTVSLISSMVCFAVNLFVGWIVFSSGTSISNGVYLSRGGRIGLEGWQEIILNGLSISVKVFIAMIASYFLASLVIKLYSKKCK